jgi:hypothetical protein
LHVRNIEFSRQKHLKYINIASMMDLHLYGAKCIIPAVFMYFESYMSGKLSCHAKHFGTKSTSDEEFLGGIFLLPLVGGNAGDTD